MNAVSLLKLADIVIVNCTCRCRQEAHIISCAGGYGDDEAVLKWKKEYDEVCNRNYYCNNSKEG